MNIIAWTLIFVGSLGIGIIAGVMTEIIMNVLRNWAFKVQMKTMIRNAQIAEAQYATVH